MNQVSNSKRKYITKLEFLRIAHQNLAGQNNPAKLIIIRKQSTLSLLVSFFVQPFQQLPERPRV